MKISLRILTYAAVATLVITPTDSWAQNRGRSGSHEKVSRSSTPAARPSSPSKPSAPAARPSTPNNRPSGPAARPSSPSKPSAPAARPSTPNNRPSGPAARPSSPSKPSAPAARPSTPNNRPSGPAARSSTPSNRPSGPAARPSTPNNRPSGPAARPSTPSNRPSGPAARPGTPNNRPSGPAARPGTPNNRPSGPAARPGTPNHRPGGPAPGRGPAVSHHPPRAPYRPSVTRPHFRYRDPHYFPPRLGGGRWGVPPPNIYRRVFIAPPPPPRVYVSYRVPTLGAILGLTFGSFIEAGINSLATAGYNVLGYENNIVYLSNVNQLGYTWPEATLYYNDGLLSDTQFQYWTSYYSKDRYNNIFAQLVRIYGQPVQVNQSGGTLTAGWWAGGDTGFITLQFGPGTTSTGLTNYYTTLTYSDNY